MQIITGKITGIYSWTDGFCCRLDPSLHEEAAKSSKAAEAVVNRLMRAGRWATAERILDLYI